MLGRLWALRPQVCPHCGQLCPRLLSGFSRWPDTLSRLVAFSVPSLISALPGVSSFPKLTLLLSVCMPLLCTLLPGPTVPLPQGILGFNIWEQRRFLPMFFKSCSACPCARACPSGLSQPAIMCKVDLHLADLSPLQVKGWRPGRDPRSWSLVPGRWVLQRASVTFLPSSGIGAVLITSPLPSHTCNRWWGPELSLSQELDLYQVTHGCYGRMAWLSPMSGTLGCLPLTTPKPGPHSMGWVAPHPLAAPPKYSMHMAADPSWLSGTGRASCPPLTPTCGKGQASGGVVVVGGGGGGVRVVCT
ncbi:hypothetical protein P7K49_039624 [Saguinus oedipus]|uniref:Uncharacterized protein n=1 Tax=Saguinus oedipus TaxID=9490 RepID=A0ABQ9TBF7_SAGOE|nr:hypothetical protein P7K49_039624 [Saguinus oedipus]